ncbi:unnamed protein product [Rotaria sp. Silwood1]|nr:unnamed protein product [Rotaria sp. Silwood1]CAF4890653.1 unnamed protein product [Rotaria sp. Silwood1]
MWGAGMGVGANIQSDVQRDEATFAQINQAYQQELYNGTICKYLRSLSLGADIEDRVVDNYLMQKVEDIKINYKQCQDVLACAEKRLQTNGLDLVATAKNVYTGMLTAGSKANQIHKMVEDLKYRVLGHQNNPNNV